MRCAQNPKFGLVVAAKNGERVFVVDLESRARCTPCPVRSTKFTLILIRPALVNAFGNLGRHVPIRCCERVEAEAVAAVDIRSPKSSSRSHRDRDQTETCWEDCREDLASWELPTGLRVTFHKDGDTTLRTIWDALPEFHVTVRLSPREGLTLVQGDLDASDGESQLLERLRDALEDRP